MESGEEQQIKEVEREDEWGWKENFEREGGRWRDTDHIITCQ